MNTFRTALALGATALTVGLAATPVQAHTTLQSASPGIGSTVSPPSEIALTYADPVRLPQVILTDANGVRHEQGRAFAIDNKVTEHVQGVLPNGLYTVAWRVVAVDGHPVEGTFTFTVTGSTAAPISAKSGGSGGQSGSGSGTSPWWIGLVVLLALGVGAGVVLLRRSLKATDEADVPE